MCGVYISLGLLEVVMPLVWWLVIMFFSVFTCPYSVYQFSRSVLPLSRSAGIHLVKQLDNQKHLFGLKMRAQIPWFEGSIWDSNTLPASHHGYIKLELNIKCAARSSVLFQLLQRLHRPKTAAIYFVCQQNVLSDVKSNQQGND